MGSLRVMKISLVFAMVMSLPLIANASVCDGTYSLVANGHSGTLTVTSFQGGSGGPISGVMNYVSIGVQEQVQGFCQPIDQNHAQINLNRYLMTGGIQQYSGTLFNNFSNTQIQGIFTDSNYQGKQFPWLANGMMPQINQLCSGVYFITANGYGGKLSLNFNPGQTSGILTFDSIGVNEVLRNISCYQFSMGQAQLTFDRYLLDGKAIQSYRANITGGGNGSAFLQGSFFQTGKSYPFNGRR